MEYIVNKNGYEFVAQKEDVDRLIEDVLFSINCNNRLDHSWNFQIICESKEVLVSLLESIRSKNLEFKVYDISENKTPDRSKFQQLIATYPLIVYGFREYTEYLQKNYYNNEQEACGGLIDIIDKAKLELYSRSINFSRDYLFLNNQTRSIFIFDEEEFNIFNNLAYDFRSFYGECFNFNEIFRSLNSASFQNLSEYYNKNKFLSR